MEQEYAKQRIIKDIKNEDTRIQVTGYVKKVVKKDYFVLDDKTGEIKASVKDFDFKFKEGDLINIIGNLNLQTDGEKVIQAQIVQDMKKLNFTYYQKLYELKKELEE